MYPQAKGGPGWMVRRLLVFFLLVLGPVLGQAGPEPTASALIRIGLVYDASQSLRLAGGPDPLDSYRRALEAQGAQVVVLSVGDPEFLTNEKARLIDGLLLPGGCDVDPVLYGEDPHPKLERVDRALDSLEFFLLEFVHKLKLPVLGICRGHQVINVFMGGSLYQDIPAQVPAKPGLIHRNKEAGKTLHVAHPIQIASGSRLYELFGATTWEVNSYHHQSVRRMGRDLRATAWTVDGVVEGIEGTTDWFVLGVQFHPEKDLARDPRLETMFATFVEMARERRARGDGD